MRRSIVSVVVPIYNTERYLERCLKSIVNQTYENLEIILVDDGSLDRCPQICDEWAGRDKRIKVIHKRNDGSGMARNTGIENATGDYICFFDSDDYIELDTIEKAYQQAISSQADIVYFGNKNIDESGKIVKECKPEVLKLIYKGKDIYEEFLPESISPDYSRKKRLNIMLSACLALFSLDTIQKANWRFVSEREIFSEDSYSLMKLFSYVNCVAVVPEALYCYCQNRESLSRTYRKNRYHCIKIFYDKIIKLCDHYGYSIIIKRRCGNVYLTFVIGTLKLIMLSNMSFREKWHNINDIIKDPHLKKTLLMVDSKIESFKRKLVLFVLRKEKTSLCYFILYIRYKLKS